MTSIVRKCSAIELFFQVLIFFTTYIMTREGALRTSITRFCGIFHLNGICNFASDSGSGFLFVCLGFQDRLALTVLEFAM